tara:strand:+ start:4415 stop:4696 length:282 start_codon:yes stop_codon:yes gene_type:complete
MRFRTSEVQTKASVRRANPHRQFEMGALDRHRRYTAELIDLWSAFIELEMPVGAGEGRGSRVTKEHIDKSWSKFSGHMLKLLFLNKLFGDEEE